MPQLLFWMSLLCPTMGQDLRYLRVIYRTDPILNQWSPSSRSQDPSRQRTSRRDIRSVLGRSTRHSSIHIVRPHRPERSRHGDGHSECMESEWMATLWSRTEDGSRYESTSRTRQFGRYDGDGPTERLRRTRTSGIGQDLVECLHE